MSRYYLQRKTTVEECKDIDVFWLKRNGYFCGFKRGIVEWKSSWYGDKSTVEIVVDVDSHPEYIRFSYAVINSSSRKTYTYDYIVTLTKTECNYGGYRYWFLCPIRKDDQQCGKRVAKLYLAGYNYFGCRTCFDLSYESRNITRRGFFGHLNKILAVERKQRELLDKIKIRSRNGKLTKKYLKYLNLRNEISEIDIMEAHKKLIK